LPFCKKHGIEYADGSACSGKGCGDPEPLAGTKTGKFANIAQNKDEAIIRQRANNPQAKARKVFANV
jgi:hypothetical protein